MQFNVDITANASTATGWENADLRTAGVVISNLTDQDTSSLSGWSLEALTPFVAEVRATVVDQDQHGIPQAVWNAINYSRSENGDPAAVVRFVGPQSAIGKTYEISFAGAWNADKDVSIDVNGSSAVYDNSVDTFPMVPPTPVSVIATATDDGSNQAELVVTIGYAAGSNRNYAAFLQVTDVPITLQDIGTDDAVADGETNVRLNVDGDIGSVQGTVDLELDDGSFAVAQTITTWSQGDGVSTGYVDMTVVQGGLPFRSNLVARLTTDGGIESTLAGVTMELPADNAAVDVSNPDTTKLSIFYQLTSGTVATGDQVQHDDAGNTTLNANGTFTQGTARDFQARVWDATDNTWSPWVTIDVSIAVPILASPISDAVVIEQGSLSVDIAAAFSGEDSVSVSGLPVGTGFALAGGVLSGAPTAADISASPFSVTATATNTSGTATDLFTVTVDPEATGTVNDKATILASPSLSGTINETGATISVNVNGNDHAAGNNGDGTWSLAPGIIPALSDGSYTVTATFTDTGGNVTTAQGTLDVATLTQDSAIQDIDVDEGDAVSADLSTHFTGATSYSLAGLPAGTGLSFNTSTGVLSGTTNQADADASPIQLTITASNANGSITDTFFVDVLDLPDAPTVASTLGTETATEGTAYSLDLSAVFSGASITYGLTGLPAGTGLSLNTGTGLVSGKPTQADVDASPISLTATATNAGGSASEPFSLDVTDVAEPVQTGPVPNLALEENTAANIDLSAYFSGATSYVLSGLPAGTGLSFNGSTGVLSGTPVQADVDASPFQLVVTAKNNGGQASDAFLVDVAEATPIITGPVITFDAGVELVIGEPRINAHLAAPAARTLVASDKVRIESGTKTFYKQSDEVLDYDIDLSTWITETGDTIESVAAKGDDNLLISSYWVASINRLKVWLGHGQNNNSYPFSCLVTTRAGRTKEFDFRLNVRDL